MYNEVIECIAANRKPVLDSGEIGKDAMYAYEIAQRGSPMSSCVKDFCAGSETRTWVPREQLCQNPSFHVSWPVLLIGELRSVPLWL
jgi:hypothetical protein